MKPLPHAVIFPLYDFANTEDGTVMKDIGLLTQFLRENGYSARQVVGRSNDSNLTLEFLNHFDMLAGRVHTYRSSVSNPNGLSADIISFDKDLTSLLERARIEHSKYDSDEVILEKNPSD